VYVEYGRVPARPEKDEPDHFHLDFGYAFATAEGDVGRIQESEVRGPTGIRSPWLSVLSGTASGGLCACRRTGWPGRVECFRPWPDDGMPAAPGSLSAIRPQEPLWLQPPPVPAGLWFPLSRCCGGVVTRRAWSRARMVTAEVCAEAALVKCRRGRR
jgi:hypothetical protein